MTRPAPMRRFAAILFLLGFLFIGGKSVRAQYYSWGADAAALRWKHLRTEDVRVVFPDTASALAHRTLHYIQAVRPTITHGFSHPPLKIPFVLHTENFQSNGLVMWMPKRIEFLTTPSVDSYSMPWVKQLVAHEYRHAVQYNNLNRGLIRILSYLIGQQGSTVGLLFMPLWALEGDAVMNETEMSSYGRGRQPRFTIEYRALGYEVLRRRNCDKWFCGSYRDFVPDHYQMGYQMVAYGYDRYGGEIWDKTLRYGVRNAYMLTFSTSVALRKFYGTGEGILFRDAFADLNRFWDSLPKVADSGRTLTPLPEKNYTTYTHPVSLNNTTLVALKTDFDRPSRLVTVDSRTGRERRRTWTGLVSSRPATDGQRVWWTEYRRSLLFPERVNSRLVVLDPGKKRPRTAPKLRNALYPTPIGRSGVLAWVEYTPDGHYTIVAEDSLRQRTAWPMPGFSEVHGLAWDNATERLYTLVTDDSGMWIGRIEPGEGLQAVTRGAYITLSDLRAADGKLYYGSIASGRDEAHCFDLGEGREYRLSTSTYGSFAPAPADSGAVWTTTYDRKGYRITRQENIEPIPVAPSQLPVDLVNPPRRRWNVVNLDTVRYTPADSASLHRKYPARRYRKGLHLLRAHSWAPVSFDPFKTIEEFNPRLMWGATVLSQNLLSSTEAFASWGWSRSDGHVLKGTIRYSGLGVRLEARGHLRRRPHDLRHRPAGRRRQGRAPAGPGSCQILVGGGRGHTAPLFRPGTSYPTALDLGGLGVFERNGGRRGCDPLRRRGTHRQPANARLPRRTPQTLAGNRLLGRGARRLPRRRDPLGLYALGRVRPQPRKPQLQRPRIGLRPDLHARILPPQLPLRSSGLPNLRRRLPLPVGAAIPRLQIDPAVAQGLLLVRHFEQ